MAERHFVTANDVEKDVADKCSIIAKALEEVVPDETCPQAMEIEAPTTTVKDFEGADGEEPTPQAKGLDDILEANEENINVEKNVLLQFSSLTEAHDSVANV